MKNTVIWPSFEVFLLLCVFFILCRVLYKKWFCNQACGTATQISGSDSCFRHLQVFGAGSTALPATLTYRINKCDCRYFSLQRLNAWKATARG